MKRWFAAFAAAAVGVTAAWACAASAASDDDALKHASERGRLIYAYDQAAWVSTDELYRQMADPKAAGVAGYVVEPHADGILHAVYYRMDGSTPLAVFTADIRDRTVISSHVVTPKDDASLSATARRMVGALDAAAVDAARRKLVPCVHAPFNTVVLPPETPDGPMPVYLLTPQTKETEYPVGGHFELDVAADGKVASARPFTRSCLNLSTANPPNGGRSLAVFVTHTLDPVPTEIHVYLSLWMGEPVLVSTAPKRTWRIDGERIRLDEDAVTPAK